jgi:hypothetical protein
MFSSKRHLTDQEILQAIDGELTRSRLSAADLHLSECETCGARHAALVSTAAASTTACRSMASFEPRLERSRANLQIALAREAAMPTRSWLAFTPAVAVTALVAIAVMASIYVQSAPIPDPRTANYRLALPVASITPGATWEMTLDEVCSGVPRVLPVTPAIRAQVISAYGVEKLASDQYELDYLVTPELGGATDARNLWPQKYASPVWNARVKDELERLLPQLVCNHQLDLATAQRDMAVDWIAAYKKYFNTDVPLEAHRGPAIDDDVYLLADAGPAPVVHLVALEKGR